MLDVFFVYPMTTPLPSYATVSARLVSHCEVENGKEKRLLWTSLTWDCRCSFLSFVCLQAYKLYPHNRVSN